ncbi:3' 5'-cyclic adenosine monophosphate phosphodiesterase CpdA [termite gut metagenome]|uniref:3' 5'-cyclic adenosine monophosphate phosphodiesterase CpdA n=1 Tax=termite gut metagenome TaxID=433724 RepID=A0A5J4R4X4_9ZZZZ
MRKIYLLSLILVFSCSFQVLAQENIRIVHGPYLQNMGTNEVTIVWVTNKSAISWVELAPDDGSHFYLKERPKVFASKNGVKLESRIHTVKLRGLTPATKYRYRIFSQEVTGRENHEITYGKIASTTAYEPAAFVTIDPAKTAIAFTMVNDIHGRSGVLEQMLKWAEPMKNDLVFFNGDMVSSLINEEDLFTGFMDVSVSAFAKNIPMYYARGNHETRGPFATSFQDYFSPLSPELYYLVRQGPVCFVLLDCGEDKPDTDIEYSSITDYDDYRTLEAEWLRNALKSREFIDAPFKVVICHMPPMNDWHGEAEILNKFVPLLNDAKVDIMLCGHLHKHIKLGANEQVKFPVLINSNNAIVKGSITNKSLTLDVVGLDGKKTDSISIQK